MNFFTIFSVNDLANFLIFAGKAIIFIILLILLKNPIKEIYNLLISKLRTGSHIKIASFEIESSPFYVDSNTPIRLNSVISIMNDLNNSRENERESYYKPNRHIFLVHKIFPSENINQLYDILIYLIPHKDASLINIQKVEYYFGPYWKNKIFISNDRANGFPISTSAFGPFVCTAKINFTDGVSAIIWRYIDFEMGNIIKY